MILLDGKTTSAAIKLEIKQQVDELRQQGKKLPHLAAIIVGSNGASLTYVNSKVKSCEEVGFKSSLIQLEDSCTEAELLATVMKLNADPDVDGFIVQLPLPAHIDEQKITEAIDPRKDVDGFHPENIGRMTLSLPSFIPATPYGILLLLEKYGIETSGKHCVIIGRSHIVGLPMSILMARNAYPGNCTVTLTHSRTANLEELCRSADIVVAALGKPGFVKANMIKEGAVVVDVGITRVPDDSKKSGFRIAGDVDFDEVAPKCAYITPVPGGVGLMTIASLLLNTLKAVTSDR